jgi:radical SAM enzyme (rSAM/lipoprotein system)
MIATKIPLKKRLGLKLYRQLKKQNARDHRLNYIFWECTLRCNLSCIHCGSDCLKDPGTRDMPAEDFLGAIDQVRPIVNPNETLIVMTGGEALVRKDLELVGQVLHRWGFPWGVVTNGALLTQKRLQSLVDAGLRSLTISLDGMEASHNWLRGSAKSFQKAYKAIQEVRRYPELAFDVVTCVNQKNLGELGRVKELLIDAGVREWRIFTIFPIGRAADHKELQLPSADFKKLFDWIRETRKEGRIKLNYGCEGFLGNYEQEVRDHFFNCQAGTNIASVLVDGSISACPNLRSNFIQGNIYQESFRDVWENKFQLYRDRRWTKTGICSDCSLYDYCEGNGMHLRNETSGELLFCHMKRIAEGESMEDNEE